MLTIKGGMISCTALTVRTCVHQNHSPGVKRQAPEEIQHTRGARGWCPVCRQEVSPLGRRKTDCPTENNHKTGISQKIPKWPVNSVNDAQVHCSSGRWKT